MKIYVASSWRNEHQQSVVGVLQSAGHDVYDFKHPTQGDAGFHWSEIDPNWQKWTTQQYRDALRHEYAQFGFNRDFDAMKKCDACILVLPCGRSAHLEAGWMKGAGRKVYAYIPDGIRIEPELMYGLLDGVTSDIQELLSWLKSEVDTKFELCKYPEQVLKIGRDFQNKDGFRGAHYDTVKLLCDTIEYQQGQLKTKTEIGDAAKLRKALSDACYAMFNFLKAQNGGYEEMASALDKAKAALAAPPRNCERFQTKEDAAMAFNKERSVFIPQSILWQLGEWLDWLFAPATEKEGGAS